METDEREDHTLQILHEVVETPKNLRDLVAGLNVAQGYRISI